MKVRQAGGFYTLAEAMESVVEISSREELLSALQGFCPFYGPTDANVTIEKYGDGIDERIGWDTHLICVDGKAVLFSDRKDFT